MASLKELWDYTSELSQDFQEANGEADRFVRLLTQDLTEWELTGQNKLMKDDYKFYLRYCDALMFHFLDIKNTFLFSFTLSVTR